MFFIVSPLSYYFSIKFNIIKVSFEIKFYDMKNKLIIPSKLALYNDLHILCYYKYENKAIINSFPYISQDKNFKCLEYYQLQELIKIGIKIYKKDNEIFRFYFFTHKSVNYKNNYYINDDKFNPLKINYVYINTKRNIINNQINNNSFISLKKLFFSSPNFLTKNKINLSKNVWHFKNIYNNYFCFCLGNNCKKKNNEECKYKFYLNIIDKNRFIYNKTDYLLADFLYGNRAPGDAYLLFKKMIEQNLPAYYVTERKDIYSEFMNDNKIIMIKNKQYSITGDTLEKYLDLFLRLKVVVSGAEFYSKYNIFYNIEYITFVSLGHGVNFFKHFLYGDYTGNNKYNKILIPSSIIAKIAKRYGWTDDNIVIIGLPKWDIFDNYFEEIKKSSNNTKKLNQSIFMMFTWRELKKNEMSPDYFKNIFKLLHNKKLNKELKKHRITLFLSLHHNLLSKKDLIKQNNIIKYIKQEDIFECLKKSSLIVTDFSSVVFDMIYQDKPFVLYIPDSDDTTINDLYSQEYLDIIYGLKNDSIYFENKFYDINDVVNKLVYYINNNFKIEEKIKKFCDYFGFKKNNHNIDKLIDYLKLLE